MYLKPRFGEPYTSWRKWFAWRPVETADEGWVWFVPVYRRRIQGHDFMFRVDRWTQYAHRLEQSNQEGEQE